MLSWICIKVLQLKAFGVRKTPIDFGVNRSKVKVTCTLRSRLLELQNWFLEPNFRLPSWISMTVVQFIIRAFGARKTHSNFEVSRSKVKVTYT